jgi:protein-tyrosine phosphatase
MKTILFLCTGNYYRSRFAEYLFNDRCQQRNLCWRATSRGLALERGTDNIGPISPHALARLQQLGIFLPSDLRFPKAVDSSDFSAADAIVALDESEHRSLMRDRFPHWSEAIEYWSIPDLDRLSADIALSTIENQIDRRIESLNGLV